MLDGWILIPGGLGLFLLGMSVMTEGLHGLAGEYLRRALTRFTRSAVSGAATGAVGTAILQSSSATTVAAVGFVSAGLLTFEQALGVIFGANLGTTVTGWLVALLGLKLSIGDVTLPLLLLGALLRLFARGMPRHAGTAVAGFALIFLGISFLQAGMADYQGTVTPATFPGDSLVGRLQLLAIGIAVTVLTQSSSAGVATALAAVYTGTISFPQAAALVIGMDVGTTVTAAFATLGGSVETRRTGYSHVIYNLLTGAGALLLLSPYVAAWEWLAPGALASRAELALVGFHGLFNLLGVVAVVPFTGAFATLVRRLVPEAPDPLVDRLDRQLLREPGIALDAACAVSAELAADAVGLGERYLGDGPTTAAGSRLERLAYRLDRAHAYVDAIHLLPGHGTDWLRLNALMHLLDHLQRLVDRFAEETNRVETLKGVPGLQAEGRAMAGMLIELGELLDTGDFAAAESLAQAFADRMAERAEQVRAEIMADVAAGRTDVPEGTARLEAIRWLRRAVGHLARIAHYLARPESRVAVKPGKDRR